MKNRGILRRMWEERKMVLWLMDYHSNPELDHNAKYKAVHSGVERRDFMTYLIEVKENCPLTDGNITTDEQRNKWQKLRYILDECIEDDYIREDARTREELDVNSPFPRYVTVSDGNYLYLTSKGKKLARGYYFYLKYLPEEFGDVKVALLAIAGTIVTSPIWLNIGEIIGYFASKIAG